MHESCGVFGVYSSGVDVARLAFFALYALQHRGQESAGIATSDGKHICLHTSMGLVSQAFTEDQLSLLEGHIAIGHNRYSTTGSSQPANAQPIMVETASHSIALGHNGNIINAKLLRDELLELGYSFSTTTDSEVIARLILSSTERELVSKIRYAMRRLQGAYSLVLMTRDKLIGIRDPMGVRPLCIGTINGGWAIASESCAFDHIGAHFVRDIKPGEIVVIKGNEIKSYKIKSDIKAMCIFEYIYFARPDSVIQGRLLYPARQTMGKILAREHPVDADLVMGVPDSATAAGIATAPVVPLRSDLAAAGSWPI